MSQGGIGHKLSSLRSISKLIDQELGRLEQRGEPVWGNTLLKKVVYEIEEELRPAPDGASTAYIDLAIRKNQAARRAVDQPVQSPFLTLVEHSLQQEIERAILNEQKIWSA